MDSLPDFLASVLARNEGAWIIEPARYHNDSYLDNFLHRLRTIPVRIRHPPGTPQYRFAERGARGRWFFVWIEDRDLPGYPPTAPRTARTAPGPKGREPVPAGHPVSTWAWVCLPCQRGEHGQCGGPCDCAKDNHGKGPEAPEREAEAEAQERRQEMKLQKHLHLHLQRKHIASALAFALEWAFAFAVARRIAKAYSHLQWELDELRDSLAHHRSAADAHGRRRPTAHGKARLVTTGDDDAQRWSMDVEGGRE
jgi:hypothetical protein